MFQQKTAVVVTSIAAPNDVLRSLAKGSAEHGARFLVIGDSKSPADFHIEGCEFLGLAKQAATGLKTAELVPERHYARKNIGYLLAARDGAEVIIETDDDNFPHGDFWAERTRRQNVAALDGGGWVNVYRYFSDVNIWPRGLPLDAVHNVPRAFEDLAVVEVDSPIQQGLADENPDVDAVYRLILPLPVSFMPNRRVALGKSSWCPFNSQNTTTWREAFPLLYLPAYCSFRMTDIWRSFVAQRIAWENGWSVLFHEATVHQLRNEHSLIKDFQDEIPGYLQNRKIAEVLEAATLRSGSEHTGVNLMVCYEELVRAGVLESREMGLVEAWLGDLETM